MTATRVRPGEHGSRLSLGAGRARGVIELVVWFAVAAVVVGVVSMTDVGGAGRWVLAALLLAALTPYVAKSWRAVAGDGRLVADGRERVFRADGQAVVHFDDVVALHSRMVNATCAEFELSAECRTGRRVVLYEGAPTNANYRTVEAMARLVGVPFHHRLQ